MPRLLPGLKTNKEKISGSTEINYTKTTYSTTITSNATQNTTENTKVSTRIIESEPINMSNGIRKVQKTDEIESNACDKPFHINGNQNTDDTKNKFLEPKVPALRTNGHPTNSEHKQENLSHLIRKRIDSETRNFEDLIDKTVSGIVELKEDLMRVSEDERLATSGGLDMTEGIRKRNHSERSVINDGVDIFLKREITAAQVNVLPAVLSNGHGAD